MKDFGIQMFSIRDCLTNEKDFAESVKRIADMGYKYAHTASYTVDEKFYIDVLKENGMTVCGTHHPYAKICDEVEETIRHHRLWETNTIGVGWFGGLENPANLTTFINKFNEMAKIYASEGFKLSYHNHAQEFGFVEGTAKTIMDYLYEELDPDNITFVLDTCWVQAGGGDVRYWIEKLGGRMDILHIKDCKRCIYDGDPKKQGLIGTEVGYGNLWIEGIIESARRANVKYYVVEQDFFDRDPLESMKMSADYLKQFIK